ncbi:MAG: Gfo/Idh/MocA family oxidoreductase [Pyrinomonadaceae bacterium]
MSESKGSSRRNFVKLASAATLIAGASRRSSGAYNIELTAPPPPQQSVSANDKIQVALIGAGGRGSDITTTALKVPGIELVAVADVYDGRLIRAKEVWGNAVFTSRDYREVLSRPEVDAVIIATPDHWHSRVAIDAMNAGKDVYCEKPMVQDLSDGPKMIEAAKKTNRVIQIGSQRVSSIIYQKAKELLAEGKIGKLNMVEAWWDRNSPLGAWQYSIPPDASPQTVDWDRFLGNAPKRAFEPIRLFRWRNYRDYGTGVAGDLFVHLFSGMHHIVNSLGPTRVMSTGGLVYWNDGRDVPDVMLGLYEYPKTEQHPQFFLSLKVNFADGAGETSGIRFIGDEGVMSVGNSVSIARRQKSSEPGYSIETFPKAVQQDFLKEYRAKYPARVGSRRLSPTSDEDYIASRNYDDTYDHFVNFFDAVRTRRAVIEDATFGLRAAGPALLSNKSYFEGRAFGWDPVAMKIKTNGNS